MIDKSQAQTALWALKGMLADAGPAEQAKVANASAKINEVLADFGDEGKVALTLMVIEMAAKGEFK